MRNFGKRLSSLAWSTSFARELIDVLVIFSISLLGYKALADWGGIQVIHKLLGVTLEKRSFLYFFGMALVVFSLRRMADERTERAKRLAAERNAQIIAMRDPLTQLPNHRQFQSDVRTH